MHAILLLPELQQILGYERQGDVERCLREQGIRYFRGKGGAPWTTIDLINMAGGLKAANQPDEPYSAEAFK